MATSPISLVPESLDLRLYCGDGVELRLNVSNGSGSPIELTGEITAQIRQSRVNPTSAADFAADIADAANGIVVISLTGDQTAALHNISEGLIEKFSGVWDVQWIPEGAEPITILQGAVESFLDVTRA